jgi:hypothetical protein
LHQLFLQEAAHLLRVLRPRLLHPQLHVAEDLLRRRDAGVRADQQLLEIIPYLIVDFRPVEQPGDAAEPTLARALEGLFGLLVGLLGAFEDAEQRGASVSDAWFSRSVYQYAARTGRASNGLARLDFATTPRR